MGKATFLFSALVSCFPIICQAGGMACTNSWCSLPDASLKFFIIGDWGGLPVWPYKTWAQTEVAKYMGQMGQSRTSHFQISVGDNFYTHGVKNAHDERFKTTFEKVYKNPALQTPWYVVGGNHDHYGNISGQIAYSGRSSRWIFPNNYYDVRYRLSDGTTIEILMVDTVVLCGNLKPIRNADMMEYLTTSSSEQPILQPSERDAAERHWEWLENKLRASRSNYLLVAGHFPVYSIGEHGPTTCLVDRLLPKLSQYRASAYISGHDHDLQHLRYNTSGTQLNFVVSGSGGFLDSSREHEDAVPHGSLKFHYPEAGAGNFFTKFLNKGGFVYTNINRKQATFNYYKGDKTLLYQFRLVPRIQN